MGKEMIEGEKERKIMKINTEEGEEAHQYSAQSNNRIYKTFIKS